LLSKMALPSARAQLRTVTTGLGGHHLHRHRLDQGPPAVGPAVAEKWRGLARPCRPVGRMKRRRVQVAAWTLVYSWRMDSRYEVRGQRAGS
jgi:hypothetical protein